MKVDYNRIAGKKIPRIEAISDGVFAVALTLLVLDIKIPAKLSVSTETELWSAFIILLPQLLTYFLSFMTLGIFWTGLTVQHSYIEKSDRDLNWICLFFLLFVSILPFTTAFLGAFVTFRIAICVYWFNILMLGSLLYVHWHYAYKHKFLNIEGDEARVVNKAVRNRIVIAQSLYAAGALLCFINTWLSIASIILVQLNYAFAFFSKRNR